MAGCLLPENATGIQVLSIFHPGLGSNIPLSRSKRTLGGKITCILIASTHVLGQHANYICLHVLVLEDTGCIKTSPKQLKHEDSQNWKGVFWRL